MTDKPDLTRVWAEGAPSGNVVDPDTTTPGKFANGWQAEVPPFEHFNFIQKLQTQGLAHINEQGIPVWDADTVYPVDGIVKASNGKIYKSLSEQSGNDPVLTSGFWSDWEVSQRLIYADTVSDLIEGDFTIGSAVKTLGYYVPGDGGSNEYLIETRNGDPEDGGSVIFLDDPTLQARALFINGFVTPEQFGAQESGDQISALQAWSDYLESSNKIGILGPRSFDFGSLWTISGTGVNIISSTLSVLRYTGSTDGILLTGTRHKISFGTVTVDIGTSPGTRNVITYRDLNRSQIHFDRLGSNSGSAIKYDGPNATANTGDNRWYIHNGETGGSQYCINLSSSPTFGCEGDTFEASSLYPPTQAVVHCGDSIADDTVRYNQFKVPLFGSQAGAPFTPRLAEFFNSFNTLYMGAWTEAVDEEFFFATGTTDNYIITVPGLQRGGRDDIRVVDGGRNYVLRYKNFGDTQADDTVRSFRPQRQYGILEIYAEKQGYALITFDFNGEVGTVIASGGATTFTVQAGALTGTTGADGSINVGINDADKNIYIENRTALTRNITYSVRGYL